MSQIAALQPRNPYNNIDTCNLLCYTLHMILRFRHKGLERLFSEDDTSGVSANHLKRLRIVLAALASAGVPSDMALAGARLHPLYGDRKGYWSVSISGNWRVVFRFEGSNTT